MPPLPEEQSTSEAAPPASEPPTKKPVSHIPPDKLKLIEEFNRYKDHVFLPKHPNMTGETDKCWACGQQCDPEKCCFNEVVNWRCQIGEQQNDPNKTCIFCSNDCLMGGWPLVRHHFIIVNEAEQKARKK